MIKEYIKNLSKIKKLFILLFLGFFIYLFIQNPSLNRNWIETDKILADISFSGNIVDIKNVRNFNHLTESSWEVGYYDETYDLNKIESVYYIVEPFSDYDGPAHTMLSFGFSDGKYVTVSAELRKEVGESFSPWLGMMNQFEIIYLIGDENDLIKLRANIRKDIVRLYPIKTEKIKIKNLFISMMQRAKQLSEEPEFYNTLYKTCTTSILEHVNELRDDKISGFDLRVLLPSNSDKIAYENGLIYTNLSLEEARKYYKINELSEKYGDNKNYSKLIRKDIK